MPSACFVSLFLQDKVFVHRAFAMYIILALPIRAELFGLGLLLKKNLRIPLFERSDPQILAFTST